MRQNFLGHNRGLTLKVLRCIGFLCLPALVFLACAAGPPPRDVGLDYWKKQTRLDPSGADLVEKQYKDEARSSIVAKQQIMKKEHPGMDSYRFDFSRIQGQVLQEGEQAAMVKISGQAAIYNPDGSLFEDENIQDSIYLKKEWGTWKVDYQRSK